MKFWNKILMMNDVQMDGNMARVAHPIRHWGVVYRGPITALPISLRPFCWVSDGSTLK